MKAGIYSNSWDYYGGGEKVLAVIAERMHALGWQVCLYGDTEPDVERIQSTLNVKLGRCSIGVARNPAERLLGPLGRFSPRAARFVRGRTAFSFARNLDLLVYITGEIPPICPAVSGILFVQFPYNKDEAIKVDQAGEPLRTADREKLARIKSWDHLICPSQYVRGWINERWKVDSDVCYPPSEISECYSSEKDKTILTVGRFYATGPTKRHSVMVKAFRDMVDKGLEGWKLIIAGGTHPRADHIAYLEDVRQLADGYPIEILTDLTFEEVLPVYASSSIYWHATGAGEDPSSKPELFEQFGMTIVEAMASGAAPVVINGGGPAEIVRDGTDGYLWSTTQELISKTTHLIENPDLLTSLQKAAINRASQLSRRAFEEKIDQLLHSLIAKEAA